MSLSEFDVQLFSSDVVVVVVVARCIVGMLLSASYDRTMPRSGLEVLDSCRGST